MTHRPGPGLTRALHGIAAALTCVAAQAAGAGTADRVVVTEIKPLLMQAVEQGQAQGLLVGAGAAYVVRTFDATSPIEIDVRRLSRLSRADCVRLEVSTHQRAVRINGRRQDQALVYQLNFCSDGSLAQER
jgi:hypothetical protein